MRRMKHPTTTLALCFLAAATLSLPRVATAQADAEEEPMSFEECKKQLKTYVSTLPREPDRLVFKQAKEHCKDGDLDGAKKVIQDATAMARGSYGDDENAYEKCLKDLDDYVKRYNLDPDRATVSEARGYCKKDDPRSAIRVIGRPQ